ncbi:MAG TPA: energy transducer TonB [Acidobacteriota bacterium]|nr:energy transducer TonB [Acidobacteriota bacterium]
MFAGTLERRKIGPILIFSICLHAVLLLFVIAHSIWDTRLDAASVIRPIETLYVSVPPPDPPIPVALHQHPAPSSGGGRSSATPMSPAPINENSGQRLTQDSLTPLTNDWSPEMSVPGNQDGPGAAASQGNGAGNGKGSGSGIGEGNELSIINVELASEPPVLIKKVDPVYPERARTMRIQGFVVLRAVIGITGQVEDIQVVRSDHPWMMKAAVDAVQQWQYSPAIMGDRPVRCYLNVTVRFYLR